MQSFRQFPTVATILIKLSLVGCTSTAEDHPEDLRDGSVEHEQVKHEFLLARERAVGPFSTPSMTIASHPFGASW